MGFGMLAGLAWAAPVTNVEAVLSRLPLPPDVGPLTVTSLREELPHKKLMLGKPIADGDLRSGFGMRRHPIIQSSKMHTGVDWSARLGAPILSAGDGMVITATWAAGYGRRVEVQHADGVVTTYSHMSRFGTDIRPGTPVRQGQVIGLVGSTGLSTGPHLHYEVQVHGELIGPMAIYVPGGASVAARVEKKTSVADAQAAVPPTQFATVQARQGPAARTLGVPVEQTSLKPVQSLGQSRVLRTATGPSQRAKLSASWAEHERRMRSIQSKVTGSTLMIMR